MNQKEELNLAKKTLENLWPFIADSLAQVGGLCMSDMAFGKLNEGLIGMNKLGISMPDSPYAKRKSKINP